MSQAAAIRAARQDHSFLQKKCFGIWKYYFKEKIRKYDMLKLGSNLYA